MYHTSHANRVMLIGMVINILFHARIQVFISIFLKIIFVIISLAFVSNLKYMKNYLYKY